MADRFKDEYFNSDYKSELEELRAKAKLSGRLENIDELVGLVYFIKSFKELPSSK